MCEHLFRGKRVSDFKWVYGVPVKDGDSTRMLPADMEDWGDRIRIPAPKVHPETVGEFTGLTDKNGKKIFEGDRVKITEVYHGSYGSSDDTTVYEAVVEKRSYVNTFDTFVFINNKKRVVKCISNDATSYSFEHIGNIHEVAE